MIAFKCPRCLKPFSLSDQFAGRKSKCPKCGTSLRVPTALPKAQIAEHKPSPSDAKVPPPLIVPVQKVVPGPPLPVSAESPSPIDDTPVVAAPGAAHHDSAAEKPNRIAANLPAVLALVGGVGGFMFVRSFMLDEIEEIGWRMFWHALLHEHLKAADWTMVFKSATFMKLLVGTVIGGATGYIIGSRLGSHRSEQT
jgi:hypothetical protein